MIDAIKEIRCSPGSKIYIFCPAAFATGGPEALHQLARRLNLLGFNAFMCYYATPVSEGIVHESYKKYNVPYVTEPENKPEHVLIVAETHIQPVFSRRYNRMQKVIWWLSVTNYYTIQNEQAARFKRKKFYRLRKALGAFKTFSLATLKEHDVLHIGHSHYSMTHLRENGIEPVGQVSDYMNDAFFEFAKENPAKEDTIIYNPKKNDQFLEQIINNTSHLNWKPLSGMTPEEVAGWMNRSKLYVDFGYHPGKERMPREACIMRCGMIIGKTGSAAYVEDMPIPGKYRFEKSDDQIPAIIVQINACLENYDKLIEDFEPYRQELYREEEQFIRDIGKVFVKFPA